MSDRTPTLAAEESSGPDVPAWMLTYADTVTLLMTFFVMLMSFSTFEEGDFAKLRGSLIGHLGITDNDTLGKDSLLTRRNMDASRIYARGYENPPEYDPLSYVEEGFQLLVKDTSVASVLQYRLTEKGFEIHILPGALFPLGSARITDQGRRVLDLVARACKYLPQNLRVTGHSDLFYVEAYSRPQDLALDRAAAVCAYLHHAGIAAARLSLAAPVGEENHLAPDAAGAQVDIVVLRPSRRPTP